MSVSRPQLRLPAALLGGLLFVAQTLAVAHADQHNLGAAVYATCKASASTPYLRSP